MPHWDSHVSLFKSARPRCLGPCPYRTQQTKPHAGRFPSYVSFACVYFVISDTPTAAPPFPIMQYHLVPNMSTPPLTAGGAYVALCACFDFAISNRCRPLHLRCPTGQLLSRSRHRRAALSQPHGPPTHRMLCFRWGHVYSIHFHSSAATFRKPQQKLPPLPHLLWIGVHAANMVTTTIGCRGRPSHCGSFELGKRFFLIFIEIAGSRHSFFCRNQVFFSQFLQAWRNSCGGWPLNNLKLE